MSSQLPPPIRKLPQAELPMEGVTAYLSQGEDHQILFVEFHQDAQMPEHSHSEQWELVLEGCLDVTIDGREQRFSRGGRFFIPAGVPHSAKVYKGYTAMMFFAQKDRYHLKKL